MEILLTILCLIGIFALILAVAYLVVLTGTCFAITYDIAIKCGLYKEEYDPKNQ